MVFNYILRSLRGTNLEVFKFGMYLAFPIGYMYYFGTNLENRFSVPGFWPTQEQSHKIPFEREEIRAEVQRIQQKMADLRARSPLEQQQRLKDRGTEVPEQNTSG
ncbi:hypothetical protein LTR99_001029 [Exophiala xenobiotica]|uniref:Mitochondrial cytochrome c oxidase assembly factor n=1 Tax=Vermiconidia calcicola TaxID=1690605 RepID=A0AAV9QNM0_9PEZI|nr:hypothetical protein LTR92_001461 [Exophiala xenobiotica]KAK5534837.1 hypothetical protein LTR23_008633 [Chaetothyriales sp. CCFEE 6169]KAK5545592.1 hypothetical protein LTR25_000599 [Vermiconidia calcicola]KAK5208510.1 hypothetical protein LTR41_005736 [Exophiala xenobiotica]KAK5230025.1 hypothetical protein LTR72_001560 [Exophiala xenobiotica]